MSRRVLRGFAPEHFKSLRIDAGLSRGELGRIADVSEGAIRAWEVGEAVPQVDTLDRVMTALGRPISEVVQVRADDRYLADLRVLAGLTQPQLAQRAGCSTAQLAAVERAHRPLKEPLLTNIAAALGTDKSVVDAAYTRTRRRPPTPRPMP
ncbi:helix-turn-helix transcriptional regulator [Williamsia sp. 1135]|uniref:helix-turn-helix transcriptional regulator n=1 Tax=Williamsia sp. 1135 TaxID=1889262 RepID=UPI003204EAC6